MDTNIPFNKPYVTGLELAFVADAQSRGKISGDGFYTKLCSDWLESTFGTKRALLTHSCTAALEMAAILADIQPGDEIIMPSYTFVSTANAFVLRGGVPVFVDIKSSNQNIDEGLIEEAITPRTKAIVPVHYAGVPCEMDTIMEIAKRHGLLVIEDAAQGIFSEYKGRQLGTIGHLGCFSFHETKNVVSGEGGALLVNDESLVERAEIIREKGTDRSRFFRGQVDKYTWQDLGSSYLPSELNAAYLWGQLSEGEEITSMRRRIWKNYQSQLSEVYVDSEIALPAIDGAQNAHMFQIVLSNGQELRKTMEALQKDGISAVTHYVPLHTSPKGQQVSRSHMRSLPNTDKISERLLRLPLFPDLEPLQHRIIDSLGFLQKAAS